MSTQNHCVASETSSSTRSNMSFCITRIVECLSTNRALVRLYRLHHCVTALFILFLIITNVFSALQFEQTILSLQKKMLRKSAGSGRKTQQRNTPPDVTASSTMRKSNINNLQQYFVHFAVCIQLLLRMNCFESAHFLLNFS